MQYFGGKARISKIISQYINSIMEDTCDTSGEKLKLQNKSADTSTHTHTHTLCRTILRGM